jgi:ankyrin repeat protein
VAGGSFSPPPGGPLLKFLFWALVALDLAGLLLFLALGLAAAGSARTSPVTVTLLLFVLPAVLLGAAVVVFHRSTSPMWRGGAFLLAAAPLLILAGSAYRAKAQFGAHANERGELTFFREGPSRDLAEAIRRNDDSAVAALASQADVNRAGLEGMTPLLLALRQLREAPGQHAVLGALLAAGADPNAGTEYEIPLELATQLVAKSGTTPVRLLLDAGADPNRLGSSGAPIWFSAIGRDLDTTVLVLMLDKGVAINAATPDGQTALLRAATAPNWRAALLLLERGADWRQGRTLSGRSFAEEAREHATRRAANPSYGGPPGDDGVGAVLAFLERQ